MQCQQLVNRTTNMRVSPSALPLLLLVSGVNAFTTPSFLVGPHHHRSSVQHTDAFAVPLLCNNAPFLNSSTHLASKRPSFLGQDDDDDDDTTGVLDESKYVQKLSSEERRENLDVMKQIFKYDLADLQRRRDYAGWVEAKKDLRKRENNDPWFALNKRMKDAVQMDEMDEADRIKTLIDKVGGPPPGVNQRREYALISEIYSTPMSLSRAESINTVEQKRKNTETWKRMIAERKANEEAEEEAYRQNPYKDEEEAKLRRERSMKKMYAQIEETRKQAEARAKEIQAKYREESGDMENMTPLDRALAEARKSVEKKAAARKQRKLEAAKAENIAIDDDDDDEEDSSTATKKKSSSADSSGRPRLPGDIDVTRGEIEVDISSSSDVTTDDLQVQVSSDYSASQSDPPMRKHCFQYTIKITNKSTTDTIQLLSRRFEIQTVGARQKDVVQGQGVTGRQPVLKPGETFEYTSTAPLSVRPIGTTIIAARMKGTYSYSIVDESVKEEDREEKEAALDTFYFVFPPEQRVKPVTYDDEDDDDEDEDEEDDVPAATSTPKAPSAAAPSSSSSSTLNPPTTLPGDEDMITGEVPVSTVADSSETVSDSVRVAVTSQYREERSDSKLQKHCFAYNIRITNERTSSIQLVSRRFEIQTIGSQKKDVIQGPGVTGRQPILQPGESFEYTSTAPLSVKPVESTPVVARMSGEYSFVVLGDDGKSPLSSEALKAKLGVFHFILPQLA